VKAHALMLSMPVGNEWSVSGNYVGDSISGASPEYHSKSLYKLNEHRDAVGLNLTRYLSRGTVSVGVNRSEEHDYLSEGFSFKGTLATEDKNSTLNLGLAISNDEINSTNRQAIDKTKHVTDWIIGLTQVISMNDIAQINIGYSKGNGYFSDPYKFIDHRPDYKDKFTIMGKWNHYFDLTEGSSHISYRYYEDSYDIKAHTLDMEYAQPFSGGWTVTPSLRLYTQTEANFYISVDPSSDAFYQLPEMKYTSLDQRLAAYGAVTCGLKVAKALSEDWVVDVKYEQYSQKQSWALSGDTSGHIEPFGFRSFQFGITHYF
jgi:hypothetical protein